MSRKADCTDQAIAANIKSRRALLGMPQRELAERLCVSVQQVQKYEAGETRIAASVLCRIADVLQVTVVALLPGAESVGASAPAGGIAQTPGDEEDRAIAANLRSKRLALGLSQQEVAEKARLGVGHLQAFERGAVVVPASVLYRLAVALGVSPVALSPRRGAMAEAAPSIEDIMELLNLFTAATQLRRRAVLEFARAHAQGVQTRAEQTPESGQR